MYRLLVVMLTLGFLLTTVPPTPAGDEQKLKPINLEKINTPADEVDPHVIPNGKLLIYASNSRALLTSSSAPQRQILGCGQGEHLAQHQGSR